MNHGKLDNFIIVSRIVFLCRSTNKDEGQDFCHLLQSSLSPREVLVELDGLKNPINKFNLLRCTGPSQGEYPDTFSG